MIKLNKIASYIRRAEVVAENSPDKETKVGAVLVSKSTGSVISEGYNGFIRGANDKKLPKTKPFKHKFIIHCEQNLLYNCCHNGIRTDNCFIVQTISPCLTCARALYQSGIDTIFFKHAHESLNQLKSSEDLSLNYTKFKGFSRIILKPNRK